MCARWRRDSEAAIFFSAESNSLDLSLSGKLAAIDSFRKGRRRALAGKSLCQEGRLAIEVAERFANPTTRKYSKDKLAAARSDYRKAAPVCR